jgi:DNA anti-recombination protein RmuC
MEETVETTDNRPAVTAEEFTELRTLQAQQTFLQSQAYQVYSFVSQLDGQLKSGMESLEAQAAELKANYEASKSQALEQLTAVEGDLGTLVTNFSNRFREIVTSYGFEGVETVTIADTEPHYISLVQPAQVEEVAPESAE